MMHQMNFPDSVAKYWAHHVDKFTFNPPFEVRRTCSVQTLAPPLAGRWSPLTQPLELPRDLARVVQVANKQPEHRHNSASVLLHLPAFRGQERWENTCCDVDKIVHLRTWPSLGQSYWAFSCLENRLQYLSEPGTISGMFQCQLHQAGFQSRTRTLSTNLIVSLLGSHQRHHFHCRQ